MKRQALKYDAQAEAIRVLSEHTDDHPIGYDILIGDGTNNNFFHCGGCLDKIKEALLAAYLQGRLDGIDESADVPGRLAQDREHEAAELPWAGPGVVENRARARKLRNIEMKIKALKEKKLNGLG